MKELIQKRLQELTNEVQALTNERESLYKKDRDVEVRLTQLVGAIFEIQKLLIESTEKELKMPISNLNEDRCPNYES